MMHAWPNPRSTMGVKHLLPRVQMDLTLEDECQIRDRSTIMARHLFSEGGDHFADEQVHRLLHSLQIDPRALPTQPQQGGWDRIFNTGSAHPRDGRMVHDVVMQNRMLGAARPAVDRCSPLTLPQLGVRVIWRGGAQGGEVIGGGGSVVASKGPGVL